jgi:uncharacterized protein YcfJ
MNKSLATGVVIGVAIAAAGGVFAGYRMLQDDASEAAAATQGSPSTVAENCVPAEPKDDKRVAGTVIGALVGGAVGKDVGDRDITTAAGAAAGAIAGNQAQKKFQEKRAEDGC